MNISEESLKTLKCTRCHLYLSVGPITSGTNGNSFLCGRCSSGGPQLSIYEVLAENFAFPCRYQSFGCQEQVKWGSVTVHERNCTKKPHFCAALPPGICLWRGAPYNMAQHFKQSHAEDIADGKVVEIQLLDSVEECKLIELREKHYIFHAYFKREQKILKLNIMHLDSANAQTYQLTLHSHDFCKRITLAPDSTQFYSSMDHNNIKDENIIDLGVLTFLISDKRSIFCEISLLDETKEADTEWFKLIECPICHDSMGSPIFQCQTGHSFCKVCISKLKNCPLCCKELTGTRNYALEELVNRVCCGCKNKDLGCTFTGSSGDIKEHEKDCQFYKCPLQDSQKCSWCGNFEELLQHCKKDHVFLATESYGLVCNLTSLAGDKGSIFRLIFSNNMFFKICRRYLNEEFYVVVQFVGPNKAAANYLYEFCFFGSHDDDTNLCIKSVCRGMTDDERAFDNCLKVPYSLFKSFMQNDTLKCSIKIIKRQSSVQA